MRRRFDVVSQERQVQAGTIADAGLAEAVDDHVAPFELAKNIPRWRQAAEKAASLTLADPAARELGQDLRMGCVSSG